MKKVKHCVIALVSVLMLMSLSTPVLAASAGDSMKSQATVGFYESTDTSKDKIDEPAGSSKTPSKSSGGSIQSSKKLPMTGSKSSQALGILGAVFILFFSVVLTRRNKQRS